MLYVGHLVQSALTRPSMRDEAFAILRDLLERVSIRPGADGVEIALEGAIVAMMELALGSDEAGARNDKTALRRLQLDDGSRRSVKLVAGTRIGRDRHSLAVPI